MKGLRRETGGRSRGAEREADEKRRRGLRGRRETCDMRSHLRWFLLLLIAFALAIYYAYLASSPNYPLYTTLTDLELISSRQLIANSSYPRYVLFKQLRGAGFNNQVQEILLFHHLALLTSRIYVYQPFVWRPRGESSFVPLSAFLWGITTGSITSAVFDEACSAVDIKHINLQVEHATQWDHAKEALNTDDPCIVVDDWILNWRL